MLEVGEENLVFAHAKKVNTNVLVQAEVEDISSANHFGEQSWCKECDC